MLTLVVVTNSRNSLARNGFLPVPHNRTWNLYITLFLSVSSLLSHKKSCSKLNLEKISKISGKNTFSPLRKNISQICGKNTFSLQKIAQIGGKNTFSPPKKISQICGKNTSFHPKISQICGKNMSFPKNETDF